MKGRVNTGTAGGSKSTVYISRLTQADTSRVVATSGGKTVSGSYKDGYWVLKNLDYGTAESPVTWDITATAANGQQTATAQVSFSRQEIEYITMSYFAATIAVTYPAGSTCTCTKGNTVLAAPDTSGSHTFTVPEAGDWIVKAVQGDDSAVETVRITSNGQAEAVVLNYETVIFNNGDLGVSGGFDWTNSSGGKENGELLVTNTLFLTVTKRDTISTMAMNDSIDLTPYKTVRVDIDYQKSPTDTDRTQMVYVGKTQFQHDLAWLNTADKTGRQIIEMDIESINRLAYIGVKVGAYGITSNEVSVYSIKLMKKD